MFGDYNLAGIICAAFTAGSLAIAVIDKSTRADYFDLAKTALVGYLGYATPKRQHKE